MHRRLAAILAVLTLATVIAGIDRAAPVTVAAQGFPLIELPPGYRIEKVLDGLTYATSVTWDDQGTLYVVEGGGQFLEEPPPPRIQRVEGGRITATITLTEMIGVADTVGGITWHQGAFYITHRAPEDRTGAVSRVTPDGQVTRLFSGIIDSQSEHQVNDIRVGPDGRMYVASGPAGNAAVVGLDNAPFIARSPGVKTTPCVDYVLTGQNFQTPDFRTPQDQADTVLTGAFVPFGTPTRPGQMIPGTRKCGGAILTFDPDDAEATLRAHAHGFRNVIGFAWNAAGEMFAGVNSYDVRGSRPFNDDAEATYRVREGAWYGWPDFSALFEPITDPKFALPLSLKAPVFVNGVMQDGRPQNFVIDHAASGLSRPDRALVHGVHEIGSSPSKVDVAPASWGELAGQVFVAEWGDLAPATSPLRDNIPGYQVTRIDPATGRAVPFARNRMSGPASAVGMRGLGLERPLDVKFGPDGALYIVDYGVALVNPARAAQGQVPYDFPVGTGSLWRVVRTDAAAAASASGNHTAHGLVRTIGSAGLHGAGPVSASFAQEAQAAAVTLMNTDGQEVGTVTLTQEGAKVRVEARVQMMPAGFHGMHVHARAICDPIARFETAGPHFSPPGKPHDDHAGDLPTLLVNGDGTGMLVVMTDRFTVQALLDGDGSSVVVHGHPDNFANIPMRYAPMPDSITLDNGDSGTRIACGVVR